MSRRNQNTLVAVCSAVLGDSVDDFTTLGNDGVLVFSKDDGGATWTRQLLFDAGKRAEQFVFPSIAESRDGGLHFLFHHMTADTKVTLVKSDLLLVSSGDGGRTWTEPRNINPEPGLWQLTSIAADPRTGRLGLAGYHRSSDDKPWDFRAAVFSPTARDLVSQPVPGGLPRIPLPTSHRQGNSLRPPLTAGAA